MSAMTLKLAQLRLGHDPLAGAVLNARTTGRLTGIDEMAAMLSSQGQLCRLIVVLNPTGKKESEGLYFVVDGNRRLAAMQKHNSPDALVFVDVAASAEHALEMSLAANTTLPMHPVDRYRAYAEIIKRDKVDAAQLARRFGMTTREMQKSLALGALCEEVLEAWLAGTLTADQAAVFTLQPDKKEQARILAAAFKNGGGYRLEPSNLRTAILGKRKDVGKFVAFVGAEAYRKAGGKLEEDLFNPAGSVAHDPALAVKLANQKLAAECEALVKAGWAWAKPDDDMPDGWDHRLGYGRLDQPKKKPDLSVAEQGRRADLADAVARADLTTDYDLQQIAQERLESFDRRVMVRAYPAAAMATAGCVVSIDDDGELEIVAGVLKPEEKKVVAKAEKKKAAEKAAKKGEPPKPAQIPASLAHTLSVALTKAATSTIVGGNPETVLRIAVAAMAADYNGAVRIECKGMAREPQDVEFADALKEVGKLGLDALIAKLSFYVGQSFDLQNHSPDRSLTDHDYEEVALLEQLPGSVLQLNLRKEFDAEDYFDRAPGAMALAALAEIGVAADAVPKGAEKSVLAKTAAEMATKAGWLPPQLRTKDYAGPVAKPAKPVKTSKAADGKKKKRAKK